MARRSGLLTAEAVQAQMDARQFAESMAFDRLEPDPAEVTMRLVAQLLTLMSNVHRDEKRHPRPYHPLDFLPDPYGLRTTPEQEREAIAEMKRKVRENYTARMATKGRPN